MKLEHEEYLIKCIHNHCFLDYNISSAKQYSKNHPRIHLSQNDKSTGIVWKLHKIESGTDTTDQQVYYMLISTDIEKPMALDGNCKRYIPQYSRKFKSPYLWIPRDYAHNHHWKIEPAVDNSLIVTITNRESGLCLDGSIEKAKHKDPNYKSPYFTNAVADKAKIPLNLCWELVPFTRNKNNHPAEQAKKVTVTNHPLESTDTTATSDHDESTDDEDELTIEDAQEYVEDFYNLVLDVRKLPYERAKPMLSRMKYQVQTIERFVAENSKSKDPRISKIIRQYQEVKAVYSKYLETLPKPAKKPIQRRPVIESDDEESDNEEQVGPNQKQVQARPLRLNSSQKSTVQVEKAIALETKKELEEISTNLHEMNELFRDLETMVDQQEQSLKEIETNVVNANHYIEQGNDNVRQATELAKPSLTIPTSRMALFRGYLGI